MFVEAKFHLESKRHIQQMQPNFGFGGYSELVFYRTYSRNIDGKQETWADVVVRVIEGVMSIRKDHYLKNRIRWNETFWQKYAFGMALSLFRMNWLPPGRGLWSMGTDLIRQRGSMALYNCLFVQTKTIDDFCWMMDSLMYGCGVGFEAMDCFDYKPDFDKKHVHQIADTREGWVQSLKNLLRFPNIQFDYSLIRLEGSPIVTFGGFASGPDPLEFLHETLRALIFAYRRKRITRETYQSLIQIEKKRLAKLSKDKIKKQQTIESFINVLENVAVEHEYTSIMFQNDIANLIGACTVTGNVRRGAELSAGHLDCYEYSHLKNYEKYPYRMGWGWMSNNCLILEEQEDFEQMSHIAHQNIYRRDLGILNRVNFPLGRIGRDDGLRYDNALGLNPCGEIPLEPYESCNVVETLPTRCVDTEAWLKACEYATFYASTVALLPTHAPQTNSVVLSNRRIGVSIIDFTGWKKFEGMSQVIRHMRNGYKRIRHVNTYLAKEAGVPESIRVTTIKPGGTVPKLPGRTSGIGHPTYSYMIRRTRIQENHPVAKLLIDAGLTYEEDIYTDQTLCFEYPLACGPSRPATQVSLWEQAVNLITVQREWADNAVSNTLYFSESEKNQVEHVLSACCPVIKSLSLLPHTEEGAFQQMPEQKITEKEYEKLVSKLPKIDWSKLENSDGVDEKYCLGDACEF